MMPGTPFKQLIQDAMDCVVEYGVLIKAKARSTQHCAVVQAVPIALWPSVFPQKHYEFLIQVQMDYNILLNKLSSNELLVDSLQCMMKHDDYIKRLIEVYNKIDWTKQQPISIGFQRCDYFLHTEDGEASNGSRVSPKLVEMNAFGTASAGIMQNVAKVHKVLQVKHQDSAFKEHYKGEILYPDAISMISHAVAIAWKEYGQPKAAILIVTNENEKNVFDIGNIELKMALEYRIKAVRYTFGELNNMAVLKEEDRLFVNDTEIAIVYYRSGYDPSHFPAEKQWNAYLMLEQSKAIKCPPVSHHLCTFKRIQQVISNPNVLESLLDDPAMIERIRSTFVGQYSLDMGPEGDKAIEKALKSPKKFVLKSQREAAASTVYLTDKNNVVGSHWKVGVDYFTYHEVGRIVENAYSSLNINRFKANSLYGTLDYHLLKTIWDSSTLGECYMDETLRKKLLQLQCLESRVTYTLMDRINYPTQEYVVVGSDSKHQLLQTSPEVGIYGVLVRNGEKVLMNSSAGYSVKCLPTQMDEVSLATGARSSLILTLS
ncbi:glutathione synthetase-like [Dysidea avara]|uniref:glutathione synthetase-like n=1 Tax=Dysidea avara TaxID=196820 RepID=UPI00332FCFA0